MHITQTLMNSEQCTTSTEASKGCIIWQFLILYVAPVHSYGEREVCILNVSKTLSLTGET